MSETDRAPATTAESSELPTVVILEDEPKLRALLVRAIAGDGFRAEAFHRGDEALAPAGAGRHDVALLDVLVPGRSGIEVCRSLRSADPGIAILPARGFAPPPE